MKQKIQQKENLKKLKQFITFAVKKAKAQNGKKDMILGQVLKEGVYKGNAPSAPLLWGEQRLRETFIYYYPLVYPEAKHEHKKRFSSNSRPNKNNRMANIGEETSSTRLRA